MRKSSGAVTPATRRATTSARLPFAETGGSAALDFIGEQLEADQARRQSFEQRGLALVASAGGFVTILFGLIAIASRADDHRAIVTVPDSARSLVVAALPLLFIATLAGIAAVFPLRYVVPESAPLDRLVADDVWRGSGVKTAHRIAEAKMEMLKTSRQRNRFKGWALIVGFAAEVVAVALVAVAVADVLI